MMRIRAFSGCLIETVLLGGKVNEISLNVLLSI